MLCSRRDKRGNAWYSNEEGASSPLVIDAWRHRQAKGGLGAECQAEGSKVKSKSKEQSKG